MHPSLYFLLVCVLVGAACGDSQTRQVDSGLGNDTDSGLDDAAIDAAQCPDDCDDDIACTVDRCSQDAGVCVHEPGIETCDNVDNDCDGIADEGLPTTAWYIDRDADRRGDLNAEAVFACGSVEGHSVYNDDCNDNDRTIRPTVTELCNGFDDDCDEMVDENVSVLHFADGDGDGRGAGEPVAICAGTAGFSQFNDDCNDSNPQIHPGLPDICDQLDNDCDTSIDEGLVCDPS